MAISSKNSDRPSWGAFTCTKIQAIALDLIAGAATFILLYGGSRSGKTAILVFSIFVRAYFFPGSRHLIARFRFNHAKTSLWYDTLPKVARAMQINGKLKWNKADWFILFPNGSEVWIAGLDDKERLEKVLGNEYATIYINEASQTSYLALLTLMSRLAQKIEGLKNKFFIDCNPPTKRHWIYQLFFLFRDPESRVAIPENLHVRYVNMLMNPADNAENISDDYLDLLDLMPERQRKRFKLGVFLDDVEGALFKQDDIDKTRETLASDLVTIAVSVDPAVSENEDSDETGIVVGGVDDQKIPHGYVLEDASGIYTPKQWAQKAVNLYYAYGADYIIAEKNQGGSMVRHTIETIDPNIKVYLVHASKSKIARAEPISAMYEQNRIHHVGHFPELEEQLTTFTGKDGEKSPDRYDALVWLFTKLMIGSQGEIAGPSAPGR